MKLECLTSLAWQVARAMTEDKDLCSVSVTVSGEPRIQYLAERFMELAEGRDVELNWDDDRCFASFVVNGVKVVSVLRREEAERYDVR